MPTALDRDSVKQHLDNFDLRSLFTQELGWDHGGSDTEVTVKDHAYSLQAIAHKRGMVAYQCLAQPGEEVPDHPTRQQIERRVAKQVREHIIIFAADDRRTLYWLWVKREPGKPDRPRTHIYRSDQSGKPLIQKLERIVFTLEDEADLSIVDVTGHVLAAFDVEKVTKKFYDRFKNEHQDFLGFIEGIEKVADREWYASLMLNRMMFIYFIQKQGFLDGNSDYLRDRLQTVRSQHGTDRFASFYHHFLLKLFHEGLGKPEADRDSELRNLLGEVPFLNGGLFEEHVLERDHPNIDIPDEAFERIFTFFDAYQWHLDDRPLRNDNEINPDVLGYIFEKYINQKQMGAYYTKEDITGYISRNTIIPFLFDRAQKECPIAFRPGGGVWRLLQEDPDGYFYEAVRHGITYDIHNNVVVDAKQELPEDIAAGLDNVAQRGGWNEPAPDAFALPTETWREHVARRRRYEEIYAKLEAGEVTSINDLITYNLNIEKFALDVIANSEGPELVRAFWKAIVDVSVLDPTCGSGAFLFAALNILQPLYSTCLESMAGFLDDLEHSQRPRSPQALSDFRKVLDYVAEHASELYYILKSIVINNLYGVDIMEEAVEICKLRLFLKLVAQLETYDQIEPLPDIDFNVRAGNTLVGFASLEEVKRAIQGDWIKELALPDIEEGAELTDLAFRRFRAMQTDYGMDAADFADAKLDLRERLDALRGELDRYLATGEYGVKEGDEEAYEQWLTLHQPFHWFVEFYGIMHNGGFDVIIGNPPYVSKKKIPYGILGPSDTKIPDIYGHILLKSLEITKRGGRSGMIIPLSITFSGAFKIVRQELCDWGGAWFSSYDNIPAALFAGVSQRCTIWIGSRGPSETFVAPMYRWRAVRRKHLLPNLSYVSIGKDLDIGASGLPKISSSYQEAALNAILVSSQMKFRKVIGLGKETHTLGFSQTARNFVSVFLEDPPNLDAISLAEVTSSKISHMKLLGSADRYGALAATAGEFFFWYWLARGDGFDVTGHLVRDYLSVLEYLPPEHYVLLARLGRILHIERNKWLVFKKNAGRFVGNYNYRGAFRITRRADLLIMNGLSKTQDEALDIFDYVQRILAINKYAGEKGIPAEVKAMFPAPQSESDSASQAFTETDSKLSQGYCFSQEELDFIINYDIKYGKGSETS
ncbi:MAG: Eco57I restriction-modification methylase domain-containing protein [Caldilineaceae bacterium]|nr:Eco57I restriction-modification methylase domain-containing protein [Caldilineaceae bacterium]